MIRPPHLLAAGLFAAVLGSWLIWTVRPGPPAEVDPRSKAAAFEQLLHDDPSVVVLGNSLARVSIDYDRLGEAIGAVGAIARLSLDGSTGLFWYVVLDNRVFANGHEPDLILIPSVPAFALANTPASERVRRELVAQIDDDDAFALAKLAGGTPLPPVLHRFLDRRSELRDRTLEGVKAWSVGALLTDAGTAAAGELMADNALERVFAGEGAVDMDLHRTAMPIAQFDERTIVADAEVSVAHSSLQGLLELAAEHGTRVLFVELPLRSNDGVEVRTDTRSELIDLFNHTPNAGYVDLSGLDVGPHDFSDDLHLNEAGRDKLTTALVAELQGIDVLGEDALPEALAPLTLLRAQRSGTPSLLLAETARKSEVGECCRVMKLPRGAAWSRLRMDQLGLATASPVRVKADGNLLPSGRTFRDLAPCEQGGSRLQADKLVACVPGMGTELEVVWEPDFPTLDDHERDVWWLIPDTVATFEVPPAGGPARLLVRLLVFEGGGAPELVVDGVPVPLQRSDLRADAWVDVTGDAPVTLTLTSPPAGAVSRVDAILVQQDDRIRPVIGTAARLRPTLTDLLFFRRRESVTLTLPNPGLPVDGEITPAGKSMFLLPAAGAGALGDTARTTRWASHSCTPVELLQDGKPMAGRNTNRSKLRQDGGYLTLPEGVLFRLPDGGDPRSNGRTYSLRLTHDFPPDDCKNSAWVHPGGSLEVRPSHLASVHGAITRLSLNADALGPGRRILEVEVLLGDRTLLSTRLGLHRLDGSEVILELAEPLPRPARDVLVRLTSPEDAASVLLNGLTLLEDSPLDGGAP